MRGQTSGSGSGSRGIYVGLFAVALAVRAGAAFLLPTAEQDGYSYAEIIARLSERLAAGDFRPADLFGFWLPLFQFVSALVNLLVHNPIVAGTAISVLCGAISCVLIFAITKELTRSLFFSGLAFALILIDPLHNLYSAACMTDVPHACLVLASLWFALRKRWVMAAVFGALAGSVRVEAWALVLALPLLQYLCERRISPLSFGILLAPPVGWLLLNYHATGNFLAYFADRARYHAAYLDFHPTRHGFALQDLNTDLNYFLLGAGKVVFFASVLAAVILLIRYVRARSRLDDVLLPLAFGGTMLALLVFAYVTKAQPVILPRYGLVFRVVGIPLLFWLLQWFIQHTESRRLRAACVTLPIVFGLSHVNAQLPILRKVLDDFQAHQQVAAALRSEFEMSDPGSRCFSDDVAIRVMSGEPRDRFIISNRVPEAAKESPPAFESYLRDQQIKHVVFFRTENSLPVKFYPDLDRSETVTDDKFELVTVARSSFGPDIWLFRLRDAQADNKATAGIAADASNSERWHPAPDF